LTALRWAVRRSSARRGKEADRRDETQLALREPLGRRGKRLRALDQIEGGLIERARTGGRDEPNAGQTPAGVEIEGDRRDAGPTGGVFGKALVSFDLGDQRLTPAMERGGRCVLFASRRAVRRCGDVGDPRRCDGLRAGRSGGARRSDDAGRLLRRVGIGGLGRSGSAGFGGATASAVDASASGGVSGAISTRAATGGGSAGVAAGASVGSASACGSSGGGAGAAASGLSSSVTTGEPASDSAT
jgi:hypothetical protein